MSWKWIELVAKLLRNLMERDSTCASSINCCVILHLGQFRCIYEMSMVRRMSVCSISIFTCIYYIVNCEMTSARADANKQVLRVSIYRPEAIIKNCGKYHMIGCKWNWRNKKKITTQSIVWRDNIYPISKRQFSAYHIIQYNCISAQMFSRNYDLWSADILLCNRKPKRAE